MVRGWMAFRAEEAAWLRREGHADVLLGYPIATAREAEVLAGLAAEGIAASVVADLVDHLDLLDKAMVGRNGRIPVLLELDASWRPWGGRIHVGARRSPIRDARAAVAFAREIADRKGLSFDGVLCYESHVAGVPDDHPFDRRMDAPKRWMKRFARPAVQALRAEVVEGLRAAGLWPRVVNGGGTGSLEFSAADPSLTEVTAGSGFVDSHLFDSFVGVDLEPALFFALPVSRRSDPHWVTCHGGGFIASGVPGWDRLPLPWLPEGLRYSVDEGAGEVQTPLRGAAASALRIGDPVFFRHAKAGELAEHHDEYLAVRGDVVVGRFPTYRGLGLRFA